MNRCEKSGTLLFLQGFFVLTAFITVPSVMAGTKVFESFDYERPQVSNAAGGEGWSGPWSVNIELNQPVTLPIASGGSLDAPADSTPAPSGGCFEGSAMILCRGLATGQELNLAADQAYYIAFLTKRSLKKGADQTSLSFAVVLYDKLKEVIGFSHGTGGKLSVSGCTTAKGDSAAVGFDNTYLWIIKLSAPDANRMWQAYISVYPATKRLPSSEPSGWSLTSKPFSAGDTEIDRIKIVMGKNIILSLDELRIGTSWPGVVAASASTP